MTGKHTLYGELLESGQTEKVRQVRTFHVLACVHRTANASAWALRRVVKKAEVRRQKAAMYPHEEIQGINFG